MALALIAFNRALSLFQPRFLQDHCTKSKSMMVIIFSWMLVLLILTPAFFEVNLRLILIVINIINDTKIEDRVTFKSLHLFESIFPRILCHLDTIVLAENVIYLKLESQLI